MTDPQRTGAVAIIGAGEMGAAVAHRMRSRGARVFTTLKQRSAASAERIKRAGVEVIEDDDLIAVRCGFILSIVPPGQAIQVAERFRPSIARAAAKPVFIDCNAVSPTTMRRIAATIEGSGGAVVDAGIIGGPPSPSHPEAGPRFYASGAEAGATVEMLGRFGIDACVIDGPIGTASALKMSYAGLTKGLIAIGATMLAGATRAGLSDALFAELQRTQPELLAMLLRRIPAMFPKAYRWVAEMEEIADFLGAERGGAIYRGAASLYDRIAAEWGASGKESATYRAIVQMNHRQRN